MCNEKGGQSIDFFYLRQQNVLTTQCASNLLQRLTCLSSLLWELRHSLKTPSMGIFTPSQISIPRIFMIPFSIHFIGFWLLQER